MDRRDFLKKSAALGIGAGVLFLPKGLRRPVSRALAAPSGEFPDLVAVRGNSPETMFDRGVERLGGMSRFVRKGGSVLIKPNISWDVPGPANTTAWLVARIAKRCFDAGASRVVVMDHSIENWERALRASGIDAAIRSLGATYAPSQNQGTYQKVGVPGGRVLKETMVHESVLECDTLISVPVLKHHGGAGVSVSAKGLMGCVWDRYGYHGMGLQQCIADFLHVRKPDLNVVDALRVIARNGPRGGSESDISVMNSLILSADIVAADTAASMLLGHKQGGIEHIRRAAEMGLGQMDLSKLKIDRLRI